jgi:DNA-binding FrmR family transcriptional regulator
MQGRRWREGFETHHTQEGEGRGRHCTDQASLVPPLLGGQRMKIDTDVKADLHKRLRRIEGQVRGIQGMLEEDRECRDIVTQIAAVTKAMEQVGFKMLASGLTSCLQDPERAAAEGYPIAEVERLFLKLS